MGDVCNKMDPLKPNKNQFKMEKSLHSKVTLVQVWEEVTEWVEESCPNFAPDF